LGKVLKS